MSSPKFQERPDWRLPYASGISDLLKEIPPLFERTKRFINDPANNNFVKGYMIDYRTIYIMECNRGEKTGTQELSDTKEALCEKSQGRAISDDVKRTYRKTQNLLRAISHIFGEVLYVETLQDEFNVDLAKRLNKLIGEDLFANAGCYRKKDAKPSNYSYHYVPPAEIEQRMNELFEKVNKEIKSQTSEWFEIAAQFFEQFLMIHPFSNGNGRTARLLLSALLSKYTIVPVSLFSSSFDPYSNEVYLNCLDEAHNFGNYHLLTSLIIESTHRCLHFFVSSLDVDLN